MSAPAIPSGGRAMTRYRAAARASITELLAELITAAREYEDPLAALTTTLTAADLPLPPLWTPGSLAVDLLHALACRDQLEADVPDAEALTGLVDDADLPRTPRGLEYMREHHLDRAYADLDHCVDQLVRADAARLRAPEEAPAP